MYSEYQQPELENLIIPALGAVAGASNVAGGMAALGAGAMLSGAAATKWALDKKFPTKKLMNLDEDPELEDLYGVSIGHIFDNPYYSGLYENKKVSLMDLQAEAELEELWATRYGI